MKLVIAGKVLHKPNDIAEEFNKFLKTIAENSLKAIKKKTQTVK